MKIFQNSEKLIGLTYIDSALYKTASEMKDVLSTLGRRGNSMVYQVKEGSICRLRDNPEGICSATGLKIVKHASAKSRRQAIQVLRQAKKMNFASDYMIKRTKKKLNDEDNMHLIASFLSTPQITKVLSQGFVSQITDVANRYAKNVSDVRRIAKMPWSSVDMLKEALDDMIVNKKAFNDDLKRVINKSASDASTYLDAPNQYNIDVFSKDKANISDVILGQTI